MKTFLEIRKIKTVPDGTKVMSKKINKHMVSVYKNEKGFTVYVDGDKLDTYKTKRDAEKSATQFAKEF